MINIGNNYNINRNSNISQINYNHPIQNTRIVTSGDIVEFNNKNEQLSFLGRIKQTLGIDKNNNCKCPQKYIGFVKTAKNKIQIADLQYQAANYKSKQFLDEANKLLELSKSNVTLKNIQINELSYKNATYTAITTVDNDGYVDKIIHAKNGIVDTVYDVKNKVKINGFRIYSEDSNKNITADCYFYSKKQNKDLPLEFEFRKNITSNILDFNAIYDTTKGGIKRVDKNSDKSPVELLIKGVEGKNYKCWFNYGKKTEEKVSSYNIGSDKTRKSYTKKTSLTGIKKLGRIKAYFHFNNTDKPQNKLIKMGPLREKQEYNW